MSQNKLNFYSKENPLDAEINEIRIPLRMYNDQHYKREQKKGIIHACRDENDRLIGGVYGYLFWDWLHIELLWVRERYRDQNIGTELMSRIMNTARNKEVRRFKVDTTSFQALEFYKKLGFEVAGKIQGLPPGHTNYYLQKQEH